jgi:hypothetical protein
MGSSFSSERSSITVLEPIHFEDLKTNKENTRIQLCDNLQNHGYVVLRVDTKESNQIRNTREVVENQFFDRPLRYKKKWEVWF